MRYIPRSIALNNYNCSWRVYVAFLFTALWFMPSLSADAAKPVREAFAQKAQTLRIPFIANSGQVDERVMYYASTFGGTVFVTKDAEIVYSLPERMRKDNPGIGKAGERERSTVYGWHGQPPLIRVESAFVMTDFYAPILNKGNGSFFNDCSPCLVWPRWSRFQIPAWKWSCNAVGQASSPDIIRTSGDACPTVAKINEAGASVAGAVSSGSLGSRKTVIQNPQSEISNSPSPMRGVALKEHLIGGRVNKIRGSGQSATNVSYFKGNDPSKWKSSLPTYEIVDMGEVYDGIGLRLKAHGNNVEKLFCIKPGADPGQIRIGLDGVKDAMARNEKGELVAETELGPVKFTKPVAYQVIDGKRVYVECGYVIAECVENCVENLEFGFWNLDFFPYSAFRILKPTTSYSPNPKSAIQNPKLEYCFTVASYDKTKDLIIDPLLASTYLGGTDVDTGHALALDASGNVYVVGETKSIDFPTSVGAYDSSYNGGGSEYYGDDVIISKLDNKLTSLLASTYLGGSDTDYGYSLALDTNGNVYVTGVTGSSDFPTTSGAYDTLHNSSDYDVFVSKLNSGLTELLGSTFLGGSGDDNGNFLSLDTSGNVYVTGVTGSSDFPTTSGAYDTSYYYRYDTFVSKFDGGLTNLLSSTFLGGAGFDSGLSLTIDMSGNVYVMGRTSSFDFPTTSGAYDTSFNDYYGYDVFISKLNNGLKKLLVSTFLGGSHSDYGYAIALDAIGNVYVTGETFSADFPTTSGALDAYLNGRADVFVSKLDNGLTSLLASTFLGGGDVDWGNSLTFDASGNVYVAGSTSSTDFPAVSGGYDTSSNGLIDAFVSKLDAGLTKILAFTYLGGMGNDGGNSLALDAGGNVYIAGYTESSDFPIPDGGYDTSVNGPRDIFVSKLDSNLSAVDTVQPTVVSTIPAGNAADVPVDSIISAEFSEAMNASTISASTFYLDNGATGTVSYGTKTATFIPSSDLGIGTTYTATIAAEAKDLYGNAMAADYSWSFTTSQVSCAKKSITASPYRLALKKGSHGNVFVIMKVDGNCMVKGITVTPTIKGKGSRLIAVSPVGQETDVNGEAEFTITAKDTKGTAFVTFEAHGLDKIASVQVKVR